MQAGGDASQARGHEPDSTCRVKHSPCNGDRLASWDKPTGGVLPQAAACRSRANGWRRDHLVCERCRCYRLGLRCKEMCAVSPFRLGSPIYLPKPALNAEWSFIYGSNDLKATVMATFVGRARELVELQVFLDRLTDSRAGDRPDKSLLIRGAGASASPA